MREFGLWNELPEDGVRYAWGARALLERGEMDILYDRQSWMDDDSRDLMREMAPILNNTVLPKVRRMVKKLCDTGVMETDYEELFELYDDGNVIVLGNTNGSCGYLYLLAVLRTPEN